MTLIIGSPKLSDAGTLTASSQVAGMEATKLQLMRPSLKHRSTALSFFYTGNLGSAKTIRLVSLCYSNAKSVTTWRVRFATSEANLTAAPAYDSGSISFWPGGADLSSWLTTHSRLYLGPGGQTATWYRIDIDHSTSGDSYFEAGRLVVAEGIEFAETTRTKIDGALAITYAEPVVEVEDQGGEQSPRRRKVRGSIGPIQYRGLTEAEALGSISPLLRDRGSSRDVLLVTDTSEAVYPMDYMVLGRMRDPQPIFNTFNGWWEVQIAVTEV